MIIDIKHTPVFSTGVLRSIGLLLFLVIFPPAASADIEPPSVPGSLRAIRYSSTAGEIIWTAASDNHAVAAYRVVRDGELLGVKDARSVYEPVLNPGQSYKYVVSAIDQQGNEGNTLEVELSNIVGAETRAGEMPAATPPFVQSPPPSDPANNGPDNGTLSLYSAVGRASITEGDASGVSISISLGRHGADKRAVKLSLESSSSRDMLNMRHVFSSSTLSSNQSGSVLSLQLDVGLAPLRYHERYFNIVADDGVSRVSTALTLDVAPTSAPDVYLLIGQSNMEGYSEVGSRARGPGGLDERVERIKQLNVQPNSPTVFIQESMFTDESANVSTPLFVPAEDPLHEPRYIGVPGKGATFVGLGLTFAKEALTKTESDIYLVPAAWGATGFCANANGNLAWNAWPTGESFLGGNLLTQRALTRLNLTLRQTGGVLRGILWHQGGADSNNPDCARTYAQNLSRLVQRLRNEARVDPRGQQARGNEAQIPFIVATQSKGDDDRARFSTFNSSKQGVDAAHRSVASYIPHADFINNDDLVPPAYPCGQVSCVHFGAAALREQGRRYFQAMTRVWSSAGAYHH